MALEIERGFHGGVPYIAIKGLKKTKDNEELATTLVKELIPEMFEKVTLNNWVNDETLEIRYPIDDESI